MTHTKEMKTKGLTVLDCEAVRSINGGIDLNAILRRTLGTGVIVVRPPASTGESVGELTYATNITT